jgi:hypothetical protein
VVYRRIGWNYGVISLDGEAQEDGDLAGAGASVGVPDRELQEATAP